MEIITAEGLADGETRTIAGDLLPTILLSRTPSGDGRGGSVFSVLSGDSLLELFSSLSSGGGGGGRRSFLLNGMVELNACGIWVRKM